MYVYKDMQYVQLNFPFPPLLQEKQQDLKEPWSCKVKGPDMRKEWTTQFHLIN